MDQRSIDDGALTQRQTAVTEIAIDDGQDAGSQFVFLKQTAEVEDGGFVGNALQAQPGELTQDGRLRALLPWPGRCSRTSSASDGYVTWPSADRLDDHLHPWVVWLD